MNALRVAWIALLLQAVSAPREMTGSLEGIVVDAESQRPIPSAVVELTGLAEGSFKVLSVSARTSMDGTFIIHGISPGPAYALVATNAPNFLPSAYGQKRSGDPWIPISVTAGQRVTGIRIEMLKLASISGRVVNSVGKGIRGIQVAALDVSYRDGWRLLESYKTVRTNDSGEYRISGLSTGRYVIRVGPYKRLSSSGGTYTYYPAEAEPNGAMPLEISGQGSVERVDFTISETQTHRVRGTVVHAVTGRIIHDTRVFLVPPKVSPDSIAAREAPSRNGEFEFRDVRPGQYQVFAVTRASSNAMSGRTSILVEALDLQNVPVPVRRDFDVVGRLILEDASLADRMDLSRTVVVLDAGSRGTIDANLHGLTPENRPDSVVPALKTTVQPDGTFVFKDVRSWLYVADVFQSLDFTMSRLYVKAIMSGSNDLLRDAEPLSLFESPELNIVLAGDSGTLDGRVSDENGHPVAHAIVTLVPDEPARVRRDIYRTLKTDPSGRFRFPAIVPGSYKVFSWLGVDPGAWYFSEFLKKDENRATPILIRSSATTAIDVPLLSDNPHLRVTSYGKQ